MIPLALVILVALALPAELLLLLRALGCRARDTHTADAVGSTVPPRWNRNGSGVSAPPFPFAWGVALTQSGPHTTETESDSPLESGTLNWSTTASSV